MANPRTTEQQVRTYDVPPRAIPADLDVSGRPSQLRTLLTCPWCQAETAAYVWSLCGSGKRCSGCPAVLGSLGAWR